MRERETRENAIAREVVDVAYHIHRALGPGLLETVCEAVMDHELKKRELKVARQVPVPLIYENIRLEEAFRADLIIENLVIIELKSVAEISAAHKKQLQTYLRLSRKRLGLLINFGAVLIRDGITRAVNGLPD